MSQAEETPVKSFYKLGKKATIFFDKTQPAPNKIVGKQVIELLETEAVSTALTYKHIVPAKESEYKEYQQQQEEKVASQPTIVLADVQAAAQQVVADAEAHAQGIKLDADQHKAAAEAEAKKLTDATHKAVKDLTNDAQKEVDKIIKQAKEEASSLTGKAKLDAAKIVNDAKAQGEAK